MSTIREALLYKYLTTDNYTNFFWNMIITNDHVNRMERKVLNEAKLGVARRRIGETVLLKMGHASKVGVIDDAILNINSQLIFVVNGVPYKESVVFPYKSKKRRKLTI